MYKNVRWDVTDNRAMFIADIRGIVKLGNKMIKIINEGSHI